VQAQEEEEFVCPAVGPPEAWVFQYSAAGAGPSDGCDVWWTESRLRTGATILSIFFM